MFEVGEPQVETKERQQGTYGHPIELLQRQTLGEHEPLLGYG